TFEPIIERAVIEGETVSAGQIILRQDTARVLTRMDEAQAALQQKRARYDELVRGPRRELILAAQASVSGAQKELEFRQTDLSRAEEVFARQLASPDVRDRAIVARDSAKANLDNLEAKLNELLTGTTIEELRQAEESVRQAEAQVAAIQVDIDRHTTTAPVDGVVDSLLFEPGERPAPGQPIAILLSGEQVYARVYVPESLRVHVESGTAARIYVDGMTESLTGRVRWVASESSFTPYFALTERDRGRLSFVAKVDILDAGKRLPDGIPVEVELLVDARDE
ncbi:MAG: HlyD family efflux transporter periplasmic adaptor subunit, partial [Proteobacteria bacterium]|nr:HlyD family efflux transporter periplasmic adaptor subunit [Pseudomonadota bacterium]